MHKPARLSEDQVREVSWLRPAYAKGVVTGDVIHHPVQFVDPSICATVDNDRSLTEAMIESNADEDVIIMGPHFAAPSGGAYCSV